MPSLSGRLVLGILRSRVHGLADLSLIGLRVRGVRSGREFELPVMYARDGGDLIVAVSHSERKRWWRNLRKAAPIDVLVAGAWVAGSARLVSPGDPGWPAASRDYFGRWPVARRAVAATDPFVRIALGRS